MIAPNASDTISRLRLNQVLDTIPQKKLTLVIAGPGYGKTTLMAQAVERLNLKPVWYRPDSLDPDFMDFIRRIVAGIQGVYPEFWRGREDLEPDSLDFGEGFLAEMESHVTSDFFLVLDDCHLLGKSLKINNFLQSILDRFTPYFHLIIISRSLPPLKLSRLMADRQVTQIIEADLAFTRDEIRLLHSVFDIVLP